MNKINCSQSSLKLKTMEGSFSAGTDWRKLSQKEKTEASPDKSQTRREKGPPGRERSSGMQEDQRKNSLWGRTDREIRLPGSIRTGKSHQEETNGDLWTEERHED